MLVLVLSGVVPFLGILGGVLLSPEILSVNDPPANADFIILLGGGAPERPARAAQLFRQGIAPRVIVTGVGDCDLNRELLIKAGVPAGSITLESNSETTRENAAFTLPLLRSQGARRAVIVTSWYHSRRALACFRKYGRDIEIFSAPVAPSKSLRWLLEPERSRVVREYIKLVYYWLRYGVNPLCARRQSGDSQ